MRFDDRLLTVLSQPVGDRHDVAVRWRQLVELVARSGADEENALVAQAIAAIEADASQVSASNRAAAARAVAALPLPISLIRYFVGDDLSVAAPVLAAAKLDAAAWQSLMEAAGEETGRFIASLHPEASRPAEAPRASDPVVAPRPQPTPTPAPSLHEVVERIERRRRVRLSDPASTAPEAGAATGLFRWESTPAGDIAWVEGAPRPALIGRSLVRPQEGEGHRVEPQLARAFTMRAPFRDARVSFAADGALAGEWKLSGVPAFEPSDGRFAGYRGVALRDSPPPRAGPQSVLSDPDALRELVHELKTPLNAIVGFAEIIDGQLLGPADSSYRARAAEIVAQAQLLVTAINDLDLAAKLRGAGGSDQANADLGALLERMAPDLRAVAASRDIELDCSRAVRNLAARIQPELAEQLIHRLFAGLLEKCHAGEHLRLTVDQDSEHVRVAISRPERLMGLGEGELFALDIASGGGFALRLVRGLARMSGGDLLAANAALALTFPRA